ncbi:LuxR C-terminal-related transcriptional regulator [Bradyrhizobium canariense]|uniref:LuxR C-terminal-related transcriptional regulator n=1 Tax=Bradyrhizobium canariense TaxID=255045 RepID=UPI001B8A24F7|nr:response regulator transcription factor [Bradyrhizobium canariense]MBR0951427.1 response regulator [Bradyrhizobium canariense]
MLDVSAKQSIFKRDRLVIVDRQPIVLQGLKSIFAAQHDFDVVASCSGRTSCLEAIRNLNPDVALIADNLPDLTAVEILAIAKAEKLPTRLMFFTEAEANHDLTAAIAAGACSAVSKCACPDTMLRLLRLLTKHNVSPTHFDLAPTGKEADGVGKNENMLELLTHRERQIARLVSEGMSNKEIACRLNVSPGTVKVHLCNIFQKLEITNRTVLATLALLKHPSGFGTLALAFLAVAIADELKASEANDMLPDDDSIGHAGEHAGAEPWKKAILRHLVAGEFGETLPLSQGDFLAKLGQAANTAAAMEALRVAEESAGSKPWKNYGPVGSSTPNLPASPLRGTSFTQTGGDLTAEHQIPRLASNPMSSQGGDGTFATLAGALIYALDDPHLAVQSRDLGQGSIDTFVAVAGENAATKLAAITHADVNHVDNSAPGVPSHDSRLSSAHVTTGNESVAGEDARSLVSHGAEGDTLRKSVGLVDAGVGGYSRDQPMGGGNVDGNVVHRSPTDSNSTSSHSAFDFASGSSRINLAAFGALAWLHVTAATKSIPPHTLAWIYDAASNETVVYVNPTDRVLDIRDRGVLEIHLQGIVSVAESDFVDHREGAAVAITLEKLEEALTSASAIDETVLSKDNVQASIEASESTPGTAGVWAILADDGFRFQFGQSRSSLGGTARFRTSTSDSADAAEKSDGASGESVRVLSIEPAQSATAAAVGNLTSKSEPTKPDTGVSSTGLNEIVQPSVAAADSADRGNSQHASESGSAKAAATESTEAGSKPDNGVGNGAEHDASASDAPRGVAKEAKSNGVEHGNSEHSNSANAPDPAENLASSVAAADSADRGNSQHASESGSAKAAATESTEAGSKPGNGVGNGAEHDASASDAPRGPAKEARSNGVEHGNPEHSNSANAPDPAENLASSVAAADSADRGNSQHASESGSAKAAATESTEAGSKPGNGVGNGAEHDASASDAPRGPAKEARSNGVEHGNSELSNSANAPDPAENLASSVAAADSADRGNSQHASESGSAKAAATESTEAGSKPDNGVGNGAEQHAPASDAASASAAVKTADPAAVEHGNSGHSTAVNAPEAAETVDPSVVTGANAERENSQHAAQSATASEDVQPAKAAFETGSTDQEPVFRFDSEPAPATLVVVFELKDLHDPLDPHTPPGQKEDLAVIFKMVPTAPDEHAANHGGNSPHHGIVPAPHDLLI